MNKAILLCVAAVSLMTGCNSDEYIDTELNNQSPIAFCANDEYSRATDLTINNIGSFAGGFTVYGSTKSDEADADWYTIFYNEQLSQQTDGTWSYKNIQYWQNGNTYHFHAIAPNGCDETADDATTQAKARHWTFEGNQSKGTIHFVNIEQDDAGNYTAAGEQDLLYSYKKVIGSTSNDNVNFTFTHLLSRVKFRFRGDSNNAVDDPISVSDIAISDSYAKGDIYITNTSGTGEAPAAMWSVFNVDKTSLPFGGSVGTFTTGCTETQNKYIIPNVIDSVTYHVDVVFAMTKLTGEEVTVTKRAELPKAMMLKGQSYIYEIVVKNDDGDLTITNIKEIVEPEPEPDPIGEITDKSLVEQYDYAMSDGSFVSHTKSSLTSEQKAACVGVVFWTTKQQVYASTDLHCDKILMKDYPDCYHGLIVALKNLRYEGNTEMSWQGDIISTDDETAELHATHEDIYLNYQSGSMYDVEPYVIIQPTDEGQGGTLQQILGYNNTKVLKGYNTQASDVFIVKPVKALSSMTNVSGFSSWYIPSVKELSLIRGVDVSECYMQSYTSSVKKKLNTAFTKLTSGTYEKIAYKETDAYWSSSELSMSDGNGCYAYYVCDYYNSGTEGYICAPGMKYAATYARAVCAF